MGNMYVMVLLYGTHATSFDDLERIILAEEGPTPSIVPTSVPDTIAAMATTPRKESRRDEHSPDRAGAVGTRQPSRPRAQTQPDLLKSPRPAPGPASADELH